ncbi:MAG: NusG domain II-containing protein [Firmicutes bacterium]|nr:NusG domain II-containing protein [Bacillota bacterium]
MTKSRYFRPGDLIIYGALLLIFVMGTLIGAGELGQGGTAAVITQDGREIRRIDLEQVEEPYEFRVENADGQYNIIRVEPGRIRVTEASCPDKVDVKQGWISKANQSIVCLPNRLVIRIEAEGPWADGGIDGIAF